MSRELQNMIQNLALIQKKQLGSDDLIRARMAKTESMILGLSQEVGDNSTNITRLTGRVDDLEWNSEITDEQATAITSKVKARVSKILDYPNGDSDIYYRTFIANMYAYLRQSFNLGSKIRTTRKKHYDTVMKGISAWHPDIEELKNKKDKRDKARLEASNDR